MDLSEYKIYMCGPRPMANAAMKLLKELNINKDNIFMESA